VVPSPSPSPFLSLSPSTSRGDVEADYTLQFVRGQSLWAVMRMAALAGAMLSDGGLTASTEQASRPELSDVSAPRHVPLPPLFPPPCNGGPGQAT